METRAENSTKIRTSVASENAALVVARQMAPLLPQIGVLLLEGPVGAGKSFFARAIIQELQRRSGVLVEDVPSPTYTLVQTYSAGNREIWHCDLYRIYDSSELVELGLQTAFSSALCLIEWPEKLADVAPCSAATFSITQGKDENARDIMLRFSDPRWEPVSKAIQPVQRLEK
jgi:tRNA threonylcarbamoyladenosine biosynthesis protein TsaE